jgi:hypothetical protein
VFGCTKIREGYVQTSNVLADAFINLSAFLCIDYLFSHGKSLNLDGISCLNKHYEFEPNLNPSAAVRLTQAI